MSLFAELQRRNVIRAAVLYVGAVWALAQGIAQLAPAFGAPEWVTMWFVIAAAIGFPFWLAFSWVYEWTPQGLKRESEIAADASITRSTGRTLDRAIIVVLALAVVLLLTNTFVWKRGAGLQGEAATAARQVAPAIDPDSIAVLPFVDMSQAQDQEYFSDGLSEELLDLLAKVPQLKVIARTSSFSFKGKHLDIADIAHKLAVATILEGSVRKSGNTLRISAQLIRASDSTHLWSDTYDRELTDVFKVQDEIAGAVVEALKLKLLPEQAPVGIGRTDNMQAHNHFLLASEWMTKGTIEAYRAAAGEYQRAIDLDSGYVSALVGLANANGYIADLTGDAATADQALNVVEQALALDPGNAEALAARAWLRTEFKWDFAGARADYEAALQADPNAASVLRRYGWFLAAVGQLPEGLQMARRALDRDPLGIDGLWTLGLILSGSGKSAEACDLLLAAGAATRGEYTSMVLAESLVQAGRSAEVASATQHSEPRVRLLGAALAQHALGNDEASRRALDELTQKYAAGMAYQIAQVHAWRGEADAAFAWLDKALTLHDGGMMLITYDPLLASLRTDPRYAALVRRMGFSG